MPDLIRSERGKGRIQRVRVITDDELTVNGGDYTIDSDAVVVRAFGNSIQDTVPTDSSQFVTLEGARPVYLVTQAQIDAGQYVLDTAGYAHIAEVDPDQDLDGTVAIPVLQTDGEWLNKHPCIMLQPLQSDFSGLAGRDATLADILNRTGCTMVMQFVTTAVTNGQVDQFLDSCQALGILAVMAFEEDMPYSGTWDLTDYNSIMAPSAAHPAFYGFRSIDEPFGAGFTTAQVQQLYTQIKASTPNMPIVIQWSSELRVYQDVPTKQYAAGMCDIAMFTRLPFRDPDAFNYMDDVEEGQFISRYKIHAATPDVPLWTTVQAFGGGDYRTPTLGEFEDLYNLMASDRLAEVAPVERICWQSWATLSDPLMSEYCAFIKRVATISTSEELYIDYQNGNDTTGDGSSDLPYKTLGKALSVVEPRGTIYVRGSSTEATIYYETNLTLANGFVTIKADTGHSPIFTPSTKYTSWALTSGNVYQTAYTPAALYGVFNGPIKLASKVDVAECQLYENSYYFDDAGNLLHVHIAGGGAPTQINVVATVDALVSSTAIGITYEGLTIQWCASGIAYSAIGPLTVKDCTFRYMTDAVGSRNAIDVQNGSNHVIDGVTISGHYHSAEGTRGIWFRSNAQSGMTVRDCNISNCRYGVMIEIACTDVLVTGCRIQNVADGVVAATAATEISISWCEVIGYDHGGYQIGGAGTVGYVWRCIARAPGISDLRHDNGFIAESGAEAHFWHCIAHLSEIHTGNGYGFTAQNTGTMCQAQNNIARDCKVGFQHTGGLATIDSSNNIAFSCSSANYSAGWPPGAEVNPQFTSHFIPDYTLAPTSPAIDAGVFVSDMVNGGYLGVAPDVGVYEKA